MGEEEEGSSSLSLPDTQFFGLLSNLLQQAGLALGDLNSVKDVYDMKTLIVLFLIGFISIIPTVLKRKRIYE